MPIKKYGQFCAIALSLETLGERWTFLILRELLCGSRRFSELRKGLPQISPTLLTARLRTLEEAGVIEREERDGRPSYQPSAAGLELLPVLKSLGVWGRRWVHGLGDDDLDIMLLMWDLRRRICIEAVPRSEALVFLHFHDAPAEKRSYWIRIRDGEAELCLQAPGGEVNLDVRSDVRTFTEVWVGDTALIDARKSGAIRLEGAEDLRKSFPDWIGLSMFSGVEVPAALSRS